MRVAVIVGHNKNRRGATLYNGSNEYDYNCEVVNHMSALLGVSRNTWRVFYRDNLNLEGLAIDIAKWGADMSIELHFNAAGVPEAKGCEVLCLENDEGAARKGRLLATKLVLEMGSKLRGDKGIKWLHEKSRGYKNLKHMKDAGVKYPILVEPFFGDYETAESVKYVEGIKEYANLLYEFISEAKL